MSFLDSVDWETVGVTLVLAFIGIPLFLGILGKLV
jgi:NADH:ubiquinone oxidoreductase subunit 2 (subunit N)